VALLGASILLSLFFFAALGVIVGALSRDVRIASTVIGPLGFLAVIPSYAIVFMSSEMMGPALRAAFYILSVTQPVIAAKDLVSSTLPPETPLYLAASLLFTLARALPEAKALIEEIEDLYRPCFPHSLLNITERRHKRL
jgi:ABC-2 type transport system permease protein